MGKPYSSDLRGRFVALLEDGLSASAAGAHLLARHGITRKKKTLVASEQKREDIVEARMRWRNGMTDLNIGALVFIGESGFDTKMTRLRGRSKRGQPCIDSVPRGHWHNNTFIAGLRSERVDAPILLPGAMDGDAFATWVEQALAPTLAADDIVICDNLNVHKNAAARRAIEACGATLSFLPAYSPDLNPIEMLFARIKAVVRAMAPRDFDALCTAVAALRNKPCYSRRSFFGGP
ncbi:IS630 family transposase [Pararhodospirillum oryzae]|uniref:Tc1-like transposase DDE domain-containing protein n=1 Tax=Pararhodospirillum oryzae TaxID=478448 RepID=A0A512H694_9PROT|nr:hypothetical protein ROR02_10850 [Pararhodospirillum oryzae]